MKKSFRPRMFVLTFITLFSAFAATNVGAIEKPQKSLWQPIETNSVAELRRADAPREQMPEKYEVFRLNRNSFGKMLKEIPLENTFAAREKTIVIEMPMPDGNGFRRFRMEETKVLSDELAAAFPDWKTFVGYDLDNPARSGRFDWNALGFHAYFSTEKGTVMIDPLQKSDTENYLVYYKHEFGKSENDFYCRVETGMKQIVETNPTFNLIPAAPQYGYGATVRQYRLAIATTGEWARNAAGYNGTQTPVQIRTAALAVVTTTVNRLNGIYLREIASQFQLVNPPVTNNATNIIFDDPATDPYNNTDQADDNAPNVNQLRINRLTIDARVGTANYDLGHLYGTGGGGVATSPSLCDTDKAEGYSARGTNTGDPFTVDYVAHEMGHQFSAQHTYNQIDPSGACTTRSATSAFEVASGSTLMSYVGICGDRNLQQYVDTGTPSFHIKSLTEMTTYLTNPSAAPTVNGCGTVVGNNTIPTVNAGAAYTIPRLTPFTLTATATGATLYSWEEYDLAPSGSGTVGVPAGTYDVDTDGVLRPLFRAYSPVAATSRTFPSQTFILNPAGNDASANINGVAGNQPPLTYTGTHPTGAPGATCQTGMTCVVGERLPTVNRTMNFRISVRNGNGGIADAGTTVTIASGAGPFQLTTQNSNAVSAQEDNLLAPVANWQVGTTQTVTWDPANTNAAPINAANVNILLSTDGGQTFPIVLKANTPNDSTEPIVVPNNTTNTARIKVEAVGNIFFDINNVNFAIVPSTAATVSVAGRVTGDNGRGLTNAVVTLTNTRGTILTTRTTSFGYYSFNDLTAGETFIISVSSKRYQFASRIVNANDNLTDVDFSGGTSLR